MSVDTDLFTHWCMVLIRDGRSDTSAHGSSDDFTFGVLQWVRTAASISCLFDCACSANFHAISVLNNRVYSLYQESDFWQILTCETTKFTCKNTSLSILQKCFLRSTENEKVGMSWIYISIDVQQDIFYHLISNYFWFHLIWMKPQGHAFHHPFIWLRDSLNHTFSLLWHKVTGQRMHMQCSSQNPFAAVPLRWARRSNH